MALGQEVNHDENMEGQQESEESDDGQDSDVEENISHEVGGFPAQSFDKKGMTLILEQVFRGSQVDLGELADLIIDQNYVGCVTKPTDEDDGDYENEESYEPVCAVSTLINLKVHENKSCARDIVDLLKEKVMEGGSMDDRKLINGLFKDDSVAVPGFLIKERILNIPGALMLVEMEQLVKDIAVANSEGKPFETTHIVQIMKIFKKPDGEMVQMHFEDDVTSDYSICSYDYALPVEVHGPIMYKDPDTGENMDCLPYRRVVVIPSNVYFDTVISQYKIKLENSVPPQPMILSLSPQCV